MIAYVTSIGEITADLCRWSLERNGFHVIVLESTTPLADKLKNIYEQAEDDFVRVDADVVPNQNLTEKYIRESTPDTQWWVQYRTFGWFKQDIIWGGVQYVKKEALPVLRKRVDTVFAAERPETMLSRSSEFYSPRRFVSHSRVMGIHGYKAVDVERVKLTKERRNQSGYDWELAQKLVEL